jgi:predicted dehydrogenase
MTTARSPLSDHPNPHSRLRPEASRAARVQPHAPLRVALVGAGVMGRRHARVLAGRPDRFELAAIMDVNEAAAWDVAEPHGAPVVLAENEALDRAEAVIVATPIGAHEGTVKRAILAGKHVLVEKPIAASAQAAAELVALAEAQRAARVFVGHSERFNPVVRALARLVDGVGVRAIELRRVNARAASRGLLEHGALVNLGVHDLDLAAYLTRAPLVSVSATGDMGAEGLEERAHVLARTATGASVHVYVDQKPRPHEPQRRRVVTLATADHVWRGDLLALSLVRVCRATGGSEAVPLDTEEPLLAQALAFASAARGGAATEIATGQDGARALLAAEQAGAQVARRS